MKLIADSGSTKTIWVLLEHGSLKKTIETAGLNPYFQTKEMIDPVIRNDLAPNMITNFVKEIHFYGAGCSTESKNKMLTDILQMYFRSAQVFIYHDILGAARSLFGTREGIAGILGTGCNSCYYDGKEIYSRVPSLGYLFGDEGAGSYIGKKFIGGYLKKSIPKDLSDAFDQEYKLSFENILDSLYNKPSPNRFLASFSRFIGPRKDHPFLHELLRSSFDDFFREQIMKYDNYDKLPVSFVGSIAFLYKDILLESAGENRINVATILKTPIEGLISFHL